MGLIQRIIYGLLYPISRLPLPVLYILSDGLYYVIRYGIRYRKKVILSNLQRAFPGKSPGEINALMSQFYRHFCDLIVESIKLISISPEELKQRCSFVNMDIIEDYYKNGKSIIAVVGHYGNWELGGLALALQAPHHILAIYKPLSSRSFDGIVNAIRTRFGTELVPMAKIARRLLEPHPSPVMAVFIADQAPLHVKGAIWLDFLHQKTPVYAGTEKMARKTGFPVIYCDMRKIARGKYQVTFKPVEENPADTKAGEITRKHTHILQKIINENPAYWLWSHRRWKRQYPTAGHEKRDG